MSTRAEEQLARSADGTRIGFQELGSGPPLVLVHGSLSTGDAWLPVATAMGEEFTCYVMDRRGRGRSGDAAEHALDRESEDIKAVLDVAGPGAHLLGHSYGAICAIEAARRFPVGRLVLYEPPLMFRGPRAVALIERFRAAVRSNQLDQALSIFMEDQLPNEMSALQGTPIWQELAALTLTLTRELEAIQRLAPSWERYRELSVPTLLLLGTATSADLEAASSALEEALPNARTVLLDGHGHVANLTSPDLVARAVAEHLLAGDSGSG